MIQVIENIQSGEIALEDVPSGFPGRGRVIIGSRVSLISSGTERMLVKFGLAGWIEKTRHQPDKVRQVLDKIRTDGLIATMDSVKAKLDQPMPLGYLNAGVVLGVGPDVTDFKPGDRVVSNGPHAEVVSVPKNLCARIPTGVPDESAAFTVLGAIALQGIRLAQPSLGETFAVIGLGLVGLLTAQILRANGCRVVGIDPNPSRMKLAGQFGLTRYSEGEAVDGVLICAATESDGPVHQAATMCRQRGRVVLVGLSGLKLSRDDFYKKELSFQVSCSYGPGRYDPSYEHKGRDYPLGFVRWTAQRNFEAVLQLLSEGKLDVAPLITHRFPFDRAEEAYAVILGKEPHLGVLLEYPEKLAGALCKPAVRTSAPRLPHTNDQPVIALIGAGQHAVRMLLPAIKNCKARLKIIVNNTGFVAGFAARKFGFEVASTDLASAFADPEVNTVFIATRHDSHARLVCGALEAGKNVFVEKPLAISAEELEDIQRAYASGRGTLMVGFNRRFAPHTAKIRTLLESASSPRAMFMTVNAGPLPADHWAKDREIGGGRVVGEACHFIDLLRYLVASPIRATKASRITGDTISINLEFADGSMGTVHYLANGHKSFPKERLEIFCGGRILQLDNFRSLRGYGWPGFRGMRSWRQDKGHAATVSAFIAAVKCGGPSPIPFAELIEVTKASFEAAG
jgi:predicted dehydrogenase